tara:strand:+ start:695 stop:880 length:186 start_codon:yes stop_codon:yes gene_type:complete
MKIGQRVIHKVTKKQGTIVEIDDSVGKVVFDDGDTVHVHHQLLAETLDGSLPESNQQFLTE